MKQFLPFATLVVISLLSVFSCQEKVSTSDPDNSVVVTGEATNISCLNAELSGNVKLPEKAATGVHFGMLYSTSSDVTIDGAICKEVNNGNFSIVTDVLEPETEYYYRSYLVQNGEVTYGQTKSFTTLALDTMIQTQDVGNITHKGAQLNAMLNLNGCRYTSREYGFELTSQGGQTQILQSYSLIGTGFTYNITKLIPDTEYLCVAYVKLDGKLYKGEPKNFSTLSNQASFTTEIFERKSNSVEIRGKLNFPQGSTFNNRVFIYYSSTESTLEGLTSNCMADDRYLRSDGSFSWVLSYLHSSTKYYMVILATVDDAEVVSPIIQFSTDEFYTGPVDLGLSVRWASCNVGASKPTECGHYFQWGGIEDVSDTGISVDISSAPHHTGSDIYEGWLKYNTNERFGTVDNKTVLDASDDAASVALGGEWRMPTYGEWLELLEGCDRKWTTLDGVCGYLLKSKIEGYTDNWIFLPLAGFRAEDVLYGMGDRGYYWSSSLDTQNPNLAYCMSFDFDSGSFEYFSSFRERGYSIRPVIK